MKVKATNKYKELNLQDKELKRIPNEGEEFEISGERYEVLKGNNPYKVVFVEAVEIIREPVEVETATKKVEIETAVKKTRKKTK